MDYDSNKNQDIKQKFVNIHIYANVNQMAEYILKKGFEDNEAPFSFDDVENYYQYPEYSEVKTGKTGISFYFEGGSEKDKENYLNELDETIENLYSQLDLKQISEDEYNLKISDIEDVKNEIENLESEPQEIYEWWLCDSWFIEKLSDLGYPVLKDHCIWGRCTTGQAILLDHVISKICEGMEILEGQQNEW